MAKNKVEIDVVINGKMQKATVSAKKLKKALDGVDDSTETATKSGDKFQKGLKGVGEQSANASKNFSKFSQGMGGFVGVYASLAAQLFAISAAFQFLKRAGDLKALQQGQEAYAAATGVGLRSLTNDIIAATDATVTFQDAAQAGAIGTAAGLSRDQLVRLGKAAKDTSIILGRDVTDSFNRLVRGVTKAEPELLDELGVILRLKDATETYAAEMGKSASELSAFERSQAVANDVLAQTEQKYSRILEVTGGSANSYAQLGKAFDDILIKLSGLVDILVGPVAKVLTETPALAIASFGLLVQGPLSALGISFTDIAVNAQKSADAAQANFLRISAEAKKATTDVAALTTQFQALATQSLPAPNLQSSKVLQRATTGTMTGADKANLKKALKAAEKNYNQHGIVVKGIFKGMSITMVREMETAFTQITLAEQKKLSTTKIFATKAQALYAGIAASAKNIGAALSRGFNVLLRWAGYLGIIVTVGQVLWELLKGTASTVDYLTERYNKNRESLAELNKEMRGFVEIQKILAEGNKGRPEPFAPFAAGINQRSLEQAKEDFDLLKSLRAKEVESARIYEEQLRAVAKESGAEDFDTATVESLEKRFMAFSPEVRVSFDEKQAKQYFDTMLGGLAAIEEGTGMSFKAFDAFRDVVVNGGTTEEFIRTRAAAQELGKIITEMPRKAEETKAAIRGFANSLAPDNQADTALAAIQSQIDDINSLDVSGVFHEVTKLEQEMEEVYDQYGNLINMRGKVDSAGDPVMIEYTYKMPGLSPELIAQRTELERQAAVIDLINTTRHNGLIRSINLQADLTKSVQGEDAAQKALRELKNSGLLLDDQIQAKQDEALSIQQAVVGLQEGKMKPAQLRRLQQLAAEIRLLSAQKGEIAQQVTEEEALLNIRSALIKLGENNQILNAEKLLLDIANRRLAAEKQILDAKLKVMQGQSDERIANAETNPFADMERVQAEEKLKMAQQELALRKPMIDAEYQNRLSAIDMEYELLEAKRIQTALEMQKLAIELKADNKTGLADDANAIASKLIATNYDEAKTAAKDAALATKEASEYGLEKAVRDAERAVEALKPINQVLMTAGQAFTESLNDAINTVFDYMEGEVEDLNEALKEIGRGLLQTIQEAVTQQFIVNPMLDMLGLRDDPAQKVQQAHASGAQEVATNIKTSMNTGSQQLKTAIENALATEIKVCCCSEEGPAAPPPSELERIRGLGSFENVLKDEGFSQADIDAARFDPAKGDTFLQSAEEFGSFDAFPGEAGANEAAQPTGMFSKLGGIFKNFTTKLGDFFSGDNPFFKGLSGIFDDVLGGFSSVFGDLGSMFSDLFSNLGGLFGGGEGGGGGLFGTILGGIGSFFGFGGASAVAGAKTGGVLSQGKKMSGYAVGGIARGSQQGYPAMLHGTEAVVPLPNNKSIPVDLAGAGGQQNNVGVTVNIDNKGNAKTETKGDSKQAEDVGAMVAMAVQKELQNQKRAGGILSPYGSS